jgi:CelD/BcsL family acetyltransferase involved in cellulose biosynthesis
VRRNSDLRDTVEWVYRRKAEWSGSSANLFLDQLRQDFMINVIHTKIYKTNTWSYESDCGDIAAALVTLEDGPWRRFYTIHYDPRWERLSPGQVLLYEVTSVTLAEGMSVDFMTGEYVYKNRLATVQVPLYRVTATPEQMALLQG